MKVKEISLSLGTKKTINYQSVNAQVGITAELEAGDKLEESTERLHDRVDRWLANEVWAQVHRQEVQQKERLKGGLHAHKTTGKA